MQAILNKHLKLIPLGGHWKGHFGRITGCLDAVTERKYLSLLDTHAAQFIDNR